MFSGQKQTFQPLSSYGFDWRDSAIYQIDNMGLLQLLTDDGPDSSSSLSIYISSPLQNHFAFECGHCGDNLSYRVIEGAWRRTCFDASD